MTRKADDARRRLQVLMDLWLKIISLWESGESLSRETVVEMLRDTYGKYNIEPLRGASVPEDLYDKELSSLYVVGKYGMGLERQYPDLFDKIFVREIKYEEALNVLSSDSREAEGSSSEKVEAILSAILGSITDNDLARMLRLKLTQVYFGFAEERELLRLIRSVYENLPDRRRLAVKYARFFIAFKVASDIARGRIRNKIVKEITKQALALELSDIHGVLPDDSYIAAIAKGVFHVSDRILRSVLTLGKGEAKRRAREREEGGKPHEEVRTSE
ncbi:MAG: DUF2192 domain-containing protein [Desulfurococcales archaeon]|nr:DUF2192 domain-containing protein [Desulfurococcales archaeon]